MRTEDPEEFVDMVAQAVIDRIEERDRLASLVDMVARRVTELQLAQADAAQDPGGAHDPKQAEERPNAEQ